MQLTLRIMGAGRGAEINHRAKTTSMVLTACTLFTMKDRSLSTGDTDGEYHFTEKSRVMLGKFPVSGRALPHATCDGMLTSV